MSRTHFNQENLTIEVDEGTGDFYQIDLDVCRDSAVVLDFLFQIYDKSWCTPEVLSDTFKCLEEACQEVYHNNLQGVYCPFGKNNEVNWRTGSSKEKSG